MDSPEKVAGLRDRLLSHAPEDEDSARTLQTLSSLLPLVSRFLPDDPAELDHYLAVIANGALGSRSDGAPLLIIHEWDPEEEAWKNLNL